MGDKVEQVIVDEEALTRVLSGSVLFGINVTLDEAADRVRRFTRWIDDPELQDKCSELRRDLLALAERFVALSDEVDTQGREV